MSVVEALPCQPAAVDIKFKNVSPDLNVSTPAGVREYFPRLAQHFNLSEGAPLKVRRPGCGVHARCLLRSRPTAQLPWTCMVPLQLAQPLAPGGPLQLDDDVFRSSTTWPCPTDTGIDVTCGIQVNYPTAEAALAGKGGTVGQFGFDISTQDVPEGQLDAALKTLAAASGAHALQSEGPFVWAGLVLGAPSACLAAAPSSV